MNVSLEVWLVSTGVPVLMEYILQMDCTVFGSVSNRPRIWECTCVSYLCLLSSPTLPPSFSQPSPLFPRYASLSRTRGQLLPRCLLAPGEQARRGVDGRLHRGQQGSGEEPRGVFDLQRIAPRRGHA